MKRRMIIPLTILLTGSILGGCNENHKVTYNDKPSFKTVVIPECHAGIRVLKGLDKEGCESKGGIYGNFKIGNCYIQESLPPGKYLIDLDKEKIIQVDTRPKKYIFGK